MITALRRFTSSRGVGKFRRNRLAVASLLVIAVYALIGGWVALGDLAPGKLGISYAEVEQPVWPTPINGFGIPATNERRVEAARIITREVKRAVSNGEGFNDIRYGQLRMLPGTADSDAELTRLDGLIEQSEDLYDQLAEFDDLNNPEPPLLDDGTPDPDAIDVSATISKLESTIQQMFAPLSGWQSFKQSMLHSLGTDRQGRSNFLRVIFSIKVALQVGIVVAIISVFIGTFLGAAAAYFGGWVDHAVVWLYSTLSSMPELILLAVLVYAFSGSVFDKVSNPWLALVPVYAAMCMEFWIGPCRVIRGETLKLKELEYIQAATAIGFGRFYILLKHIIPNTVHLMFINFSLLFIAAIKFEVVLSFLGLGVKVGPSWGRMIQESTQEVINGIFWQIGAATAFMFVLVLAFNIVSDALQDAFDPKHVG
jgi:peptide/nickel transport system permease protein